MRERGSTRVLLSWGLALLLILASALTPSRAVESYIFTEEPLVRFSPDLGEPDLFGYAAALHRVDDTGSADDFDHAIMNTKILVGAPSGTYPGGLSFSGLNDTDRVDRTGLVYVCPIVPGDCQALMGNGVGNDIRMFDYENNEFIEDPFDADRDYQIEEKSDQFMGATIVSTGEHVLICAPRWISRDTSDTMFGPFDKTRAHGRCFLSGQNLTDFQLLRPCTMDRSQSLSGQAYCMAGTAATAFEREASKLSVFLGGPPFDDSNGRVFQYDIVDNQVPNMFQNIPDSKVKRLFWYSGISVTTGYIFSLDERDLIYSLPKKNDYRGSVEVFNLTSDMVMDELFGEQMGEYFGWIVATADLNGDGYDEIIVGAPLYSTPDKIERGRIFVYRNNGTLDTENPIVIPGTVTKGRFGSAIANLGDINSDGFQDIAVSAPFEEDGMEDGAEGSVYIFLGSGDTYINRAGADGVKYDERITALQISQLLGLESSDYLQSFGYSLASGVDVDANLNYDLVIGGIKQQAIVVLRTHSIANISLSIATFPEKDFNYVKDCSIGEILYACFQLEISAIFSGRGYDGHSLDVTVTVTENPVPSGPRLFFLNSSGDRVDSFEGSINFPTTNELAKKNITIYAENDDISDRRSPLSVAVTISPLERQPRKVNGSQDIIDLRDIPILNVLPQNNVKQELTLAGCAEATCRPDLTLSVAMVQYLDSEQGQTEYDGIVAGGVRYLGVFLNYMTLSEDAIGSFLTLDLPASILDAPQRITSVIGITNTPTAELATSQCRSVNDTYVCSLQEHISSRDGLLRVRILIPVRDGVTGLEDDAIAHVMIRDEGENDIDVTNNNITLPLSVSAIVSVEIEEVDITPKQTQYGDNDDLGTRISIKTTLLRSGPSSIPSAELRIFLPGKTDTTGDDYFLYPISYTSSSSTVTCSGLNPDNREPSSSQERRRRRRSSENREQRIRKREITESLNCEENRDVCTPIVCSITDFNRGQLTVTIISHVDNGFFQSQSGDFVFHAYATFNSPFIDGQQTKVSNELTVQEEDEKTSQSVPVWVYIVSGLAALIILAAIILLLYMVGFFRLRRKEGIVKQREEMTQLQGSAATATTAAAASLDSKPEKPDEDTPTEISEEPELDEKPPAYPTLQDKGENFNDVPNETEL